MLQSILKIVYKYKNLIYKNPVKIRYKNKLFLNQKIKNKKYSVNVWFCFVHFFIQSIYGFVFLISLFCKNS